MCHTWDRYFPNTRHVVALVGAITTIAPEPMVTNRDTTTSAIANSPEIRLQRNTSAMIVSIQILEARESIARDARRLAPPSALFFHCAAGSVRFSSGRRSIGTRRVAVAFSPPCTAAVLRIIISFTVTTAGK